MVMKKEEATPHLVVVCYPAQGHINPARELAQRLVRATGGSCRVTVCTAASACRRMLGAEEVVDDDSATGVRYMAFSDADIMDQKSPDYMAQLRLVGPRALAAVLARLGDAGMPATMVLYTVLLSWVPAVALAHGVPAVLYWIQSATTLAAYYHLLQDEGSFASPSPSVRIPGLPAPLHARDLPSFLLSSSNSSTDALVRSTVRELFDTLRRQHRPIVLANTFEAMEPDAVATLRQHGGLDVVTVGPLLPNTSSSKQYDLFKQADSRSLKEEGWLDARPTGSVVYISFGSMSVMSERQIAEVSRAMAQSGRPFLWVLREDNPRGGQLQEQEQEQQDTTTKGMIVPWCHQGKVLSHPALGCFVTHCGWNSTLESVAAGVPLVCVPQWTDQPTNAWLLEQLGTGVRAALVCDKADGGVLLEATELQRCIGLAMSDHVRAKAALWKDKARAAAAHSETNLTDALLPKLLKHGAANTTLL